MDFRFGNREGKKVRKSWETERLHPRPGRAGSPAEQQQRGAGAPFPTSNFVFRPSGRTPRDRRLLQHPVNGGACVRRQRRRRGGHSRRATFGEALPRGHGVELGDDLLRVVVVKRDERREQSKALNKNFLLFTSFLLSSLWLSVFKLAPPCR
jgi:hypothetical protein